MKFILGGESPLKFRALDDAADCEFNDPKVVTHPLDLEFPAQPVGFDEMEEGARLRSRAVLAANPPGLFYAVGIESGIELRDDQWHDYAVISVRSDVIEIIGRTDSILFPTDCVEIARERGFKTTTVGSVIAEKYGCDPKDPHSYLTKGSHSRESFIRRALMDILKRLY